MADYGPVRSVLEDAQQHGFLGPGPVDAHIDHAHALIAAFPDHPGTFIDLGSGGGVPGLIIALERSDWTGVLLDSSVKRTDFLLGAIGQLGLGDRMGVAAGRAEDIGRSTVHRGSADVVVARSFASPPVTAECGAPLLRVGGLLIVSDPPTDAGSDQRWIPAGLGKLGLVIQTQRTERPAFTVLLQQARCPARFPRRVGIPAKRPLF